MAKLADIVIFDENLKFDSGAAFLLHQCPHINAKVQFDSGWEVEIQADVPYIVVRGKGGTETTSADIALEYAQKGLDQIAVQTGITLFTSSEADHYLLWWRKKINFLRVVDVISPPPQLFSKEPDPRDFCFSLQISESIYSESLRYIREAFSSNNAFDIYRYLHLALENLCSSIEPKPKNKCEEDWFVDVLTKKVSNYNPKLYTEEIVRSVYKTRCELFHAKSDKRKLLTHNLMDMETLYEQLSNLITITKFVVKEHLGIEMNISPLREYLTGLTLSQQAFEARWQIWSDVQLYASSQEALLSGCGPDELSNFLEKDSIWLLNTHHSSFYQNSSQKAMIGTKNLDHYQKSDKLTGFLLKKDDELYGTIHLKAKLDCEYIDCLEVVCCFKANVGIAI